MRNTLRQPVGVRLRDALPDAQVFGAHDVYATSCSCDASRTCPGDVYFALDADAGDACEQARTAVERGAVAIVVDRLTPIFGTPQYLTDDARRAFSAFCQRLVGAPSRRLRITGVAGAHGKSSVATLLSSILRTAGLNVGALTSSGETVGASSNACDLPATAPRVARWLSECVVADCDRAVAVLGGNALADRSFSGVSLEALCLTNMNFDRAGGRSPDAGRRLAAGAMELLSPSGVLVANADDSYAMRLLAEARGTAITFGIDKPADVAARVLQEHSGGQLIAVTLGHETALIESSIVGPAHARNCLGAIASAVTQGVDLTTAARGVERVTSLAGVMQPAPCGQAFPVYLDSGASPERVRAALTAARPAAGERLFAVLPEGASEAVQAVAASMSDLAITPGDFQPSLERAANVRTVDDRFSAIALALALADPGDAVLIAGCARSPSARSAEETTIRELLAMRLAQPQEPAVTP